MKKILLPIFALVAMVFAACGGDDTAPAKIAVTGISLDKTSLALEIGEEATVKATIEPAKASNKKVVWSIADATIASVNNGEVKGLKEGETTLTAKTVDGNFTATIPVKVVTEKVAVEELIILGGGELQLGEKCVMGVRIKPSNATNQKVSFTCSPELVSIEENIEDSTPGMIAYDVTPLGEGNVTFTAVSEDGGITATKNIAVSAPTKVTEINILPKNAAIEVGETKQFTAVIGPSDANNKEVEWSSSDTSVATVKATSINYVAEVTGVGNGTATITATAKDGSGVKGSATITVVDKKPTSITFDGTAPYEFYYWQGKVIDFKNDLKMKVEPADADFSIIEWGISIQSARTDVSGEEVKYEVKDNNITLSYAHSTNWVAKETVEITATVNGSTLASASINFINRGVLFYPSNYNSLFYDLAMQGNKMNWEKASPTKLKFICYNRVVGTGSIPSYDNYKIPASEYTLTSSDTSKIKVTRNDDGESWMVERLNTTDLAAVTLTYKCGEHTQTYTINLIP